MSGVLGVFSTINQNRPTPRKIIMKFQNTKNTISIKTPEREKKAIIYKGWVPWIVLRAINTGRKQWTNGFKILKEKIAII